MVRRILDAARQSDWYNSRDDPTRDGATFTLSDLPEDVAADLNKEKEEVKVEDAPEQGLKSRKRRRRRKALRRTRRKKRRRRTKRGVMDGEPEKKEAVRLSMTLSRTVSSLFFRTSPHAFANLR